MSDRRRKPGRRVALSPAHVRTIGDEIERLIAILDLVEPDPDLEENGDLEPSLGYYFGSEPDLELDTADDEPSLGSLDRAIDQRRANECNAIGGGEDLELDRSDYEPSLGSPAVSIGDQTRWSHGIDAEANGDELDQNGDERDADQDGEPSLGAPELGPDDSQLGWGKGCNGGQDFELQEESRAPDILRAKARVETRRVAGAFLEVRP